MKILFFLFVLVVARPSFAQDVSTYDVVMSGKKCSEQNSIQQLDCKYVVGKSLSFEISGIGMRDRGVTVYKSDFDGDYYISYGVGHGCVIVKNSKNILNLAFVSPKNGKVYKTWEACQSGY